MVNLPESPTLHFLYLESELAYKNACMDLLFACMNLSLKRVDMCLCEKAGRLRVVGKMEGHHRALQRAGGECAVQPLL